MDIVTKLFLCNWCVITFVAWVDWILGSPSDEKVWLGAVLGIWLALSIGSAGLYIPYFFFAVIN